MREVVALPGRAEGSVVQTADVFTSRDGRLMRADGYPPHADRYAAHGFDLAGPAHQASGQRPRLAATSYG